MTRILCLLLVFMWSVGIQASKGYRIKVTIPSLADSTVILAHHFSKSIFPDDTIRLNRKGKGVFEGKKTLSHGLYVVFIPSKGKYFDVIIGDDQQFALKTDTANFMELMSVKGSVENELFYMYQRHLTVKRNEARKLSEQLKAAKTEAEKKEPSEKLKQMDGEMKAYIQKLLDEVPGSFLSKFVTALKEIEVPDPPKDDQGNVIDKNFQYQYYKSHYFDNMPVSDPDFLRTPFFENKILTYLDKVAPQVPDSLNNEVDRIIEQSRTTPELFRFMLVSLFNHYAQSQIMGQDAVLIHLAEKYYIPEATWSDSVFIDKLKKQVKTQSPLLIGKKAPDVELVQIPDEHFMEAAEDTSVRKNVYVGNFFKLSQISAKYTILFFWEADCGHCKKATPQLHEVYNRLKDKGVQVVAVHQLFGVDGKVKWIDFVNEHKLYGWVNAWNPYDYSFKEAYDITSTPVLFVLDSDMKIIAKRLGPEQAEELINYLLSSEKK